MQGNPPLASAAPAGSDQGKCNNVLSAGLPALQMGPVTTCPKEAGYMG